MDQQRRTLRVGAAAVLCAVCLRLVSSGGLDTFAHTVQPEKLASFLMYVETGRILRPAPPSFETVPTGTATSPTVTATEPTAETLAVSAPDRPVFTAEDISGVSIRYSCDFYPDLEPLLTAPLDWNLVGSEPTVLIYHTHATESYTKSPGEEYTESGSFRTLDDHYNMVSVGERLAQVLEAGGITVLHDKTHHDYPSYSGSYAASRDTVTEYLKQYPTIQLMLDLHRDAAEDASGQQVALIAQVDGEQLARVMPVVGSEMGGLTFPGWRENLGLAMKLQVQMERESPGLCRSINFCSQRYNEDLLPGALLIEIGAAGNTHPQALSAAEALGKTILSLARGSG